jgi:hypothetical protein
MKTKTKNQMMNLKKRLFSAVIALVVLLSVATAQETDSIQTVFKTDVKVSELWTPEIKINSIQGDIGTLIGFYGGALINRSVLVGVSGGVNLGHPRVNYGYFGSIGQFIFKSEKMVHCSSQLLIAFGTTKDYENPKKGLLDNFWNISGENFFLMEPGINLELNLSKNITFVAGISYRFVSGLNENSEDVAKTRVTSRDMSGLNFNIGMKFGKEKKTKKSE